MIRVPSRALGADGLSHDGPSGAHGTLWVVLFSSTDVCPMVTRFLLQESQQGVVLRLFQSLSEWIMGTPTSMDRTPL